LRERRRKKRFQVDFFEKNGAQIFPRKQKKFDKKAKKSKNAARKA